MPAGPLLQAAQFFAYPTSYLIDTEHGVIVDAASSGDPEPSQVDRTLITILKNAVNMVGTHILDHVVVGHEGCVSLVEQGYL